MAFCLTEALALIDHYDFLDTMSSTAKANGKTPPQEASKSLAAAAVGWTLGTTDAPRWTASERICHG